MQFGRDTEEALFLFDENIAQYLRELSNRAVRLHAVVKIRESSAFRPVMNLQSLLYEETALVLWFTGQ
jgi:hypothetical protein